jgi:hypothetical protein
MKVKEKEDVDRPGWIMEEGVEGEGLEYEGDGVDRSGEGVLKAESSEVVPEKTEEGQEKVSEKDSVEDFKNSAEWQQLYKASAYRGETEAKEAEGMAVVDYGVPKAYTIHSIPPVSTSHLPTVHTPLFSLISR